MTEQNNQPTTTSTDAVYVLGNFDLVNETNSIKIFRNLDDAKTAQEKLFQEIKPNYEYYQDHRNTNDFANHDYMIEFGNDDLDNYPCEAYLEIQKLPVK